MKIKYKSFGGYPIIEIKKGDWIDLYVTEDIEFKGLEKNKRNNRVNYSYRLIPLNVAMELPQGYEAIVAPRSSTFSKYGLLMVNGIGVIDNSYCGDNDRWQFPAIGLKPYTLHKGHRIAQFRIQLSQKATLWQKIKWLFTRKIEFVQVANLGNAERGGFGTTGRVEIKDIWNEEQVKKVLSNEKKED